MSKSNSTTKTTVAANDAAFRQFFTRLSQADIQRIAGDSSSSSAIASKAPTRRDILAHECYVQLHSSLPQIHVHHLEALREWVSDNLLLASSSSSSPSINPDAKFNVPRSSSEYVSFNLTIPLLTAIRNLARTPPAHTRTSGGLNTTASATSSKVNDEDSNEPSFAEALRADAGRAMQPLSSSSSVAASSTASAKKKLDETTTEVDLSRTGTSIDARAHAAAGLYALLTVQTVSAAFSSTSAAASSSSSTPSLIASSSFLRHIPISLAAEALEREQVDAQLKQIAPIFDVPEIDLALAADAMKDDEEVKGQEPEVDEDHGVIALDSDDSDDDFTADPVPLDSDTEETVDANNPLSSDYLSSLLSSDSSVAAPSSSSQASIISRLLQLISLWDIEIFTLGDIFVSTKLHEHLLQVWRHAKRAKLSQNVLSELRETLLSLYRTQMLQHAECIQMYLGSIVQEILELPYDFIPGSGAAASSSKFDSIPPSSSSFNPRSTLIILLSQLCESISIQPFPSQPSTAATPSNTTPSNLLAARKYLHSFLLHNLSHFTYRLQKCRVEFQENLNDHTSLIYEYTQLRARLSEMHHLCTIFSYLVWNHPKLAGASMKEKDDEVGQILIDSKVVYHLMAIVMLNQHAMFHAQRHGLKEDEDVTQTTESEFCMEYEAWRANDFLVNMRVANDGTISTTIERYSSPPSASSSSSSSSDSTLLRTLPPSNPLHFVHQLLFLCVSVSPLTSRLVFSHPTFIPFISSSCYEDQHVLVSMLLPVCVAMQTREKTIEQVLVPPTPSAPKVEPVTNETEKKSKVKKTKLVVASLDTESTSASSSSSTAATTSAVATDELSWSHYSSSPKFLLASLKRSLHILTSASAQLRQFSSSAASSTASSASTLSSAILPDREIDLLHHLLHRICIIASFSPARRLTLILLASGKLPARDLDPARSEERDTLQAVLAALVSLRTILPAVSKRISDQLDNRSTISDAASSSSLTSDELSELDAVSESAAGRSERQTKSRFESAQSNLHQMQRYLKGLTNDSAKKD